MSDPPDDGTAGPSDDATAADDESADGATSQRDEASPEGAASANATDAGEPPEDATAESAMDADHTYVESQVIMTTVRVVAPFAFTYGLFLTFHGGGSPGGGFQGGAVIGTTVLMIAFAFGIEPTRDWLSNRAVVGLASGGVLAFALIGLLPLLEDGRFLEHAVYGQEFDLYHGKKYALEAVEIVGIAPIVASIVIGLFFAIAAGFSGEVAPWEPAPTEPATGSDGDVTDERDGGEQA